ncbi:MAG: hypothetical protein IJI38_03240, partial [Clostridia bacterium]|nr:hypothetical protein [Clostridia bacterium]
MSRAIALPPMADGFALEGKVSPQTSCFPGQAGAAGYNSYHIRPARFVKTQKKLPQRTEEARVLFQMMRLLLDHVIVGHVSGVAGLGINHLAPDL